MYRTNWKYIPPKLATYDPNSLMGFRYILTPSFVCGNVFSPMMLESLLFQNYHGRPNLVRLIRLLAGWRTRNNIQMDQEMGVNTNYLSIIDVPDEIFESPETATFGYLFLYLQQNFEILALAIVRDKNKVLKNSFPFVYTNPLPTTPVIPKDRVFVLSHRPPTSPIKHD